MWTFVRVTRLYMENPHLYATLSFYWHEINNVWPYCISLTQDRGMRSEHQVWPLTQFFLFPFFDPSSGKHYSFPFLPATPLSPSRTLEGLFELTRRPSRALDSPRALLPELQRYKDTVRCGALGAEVPGHRQQQLTQTLILGLLKTHLFTPILDCEKSTE